MAFLGIPANTVEILQKHHVNIQKKYGQNFLVDTRVLEKIVEAARITEEDRVVEIGPGIGTLTQYLAERAGAVTAVEIDKNLIPILEETLAAYENVTVINADILKMDLDSLFQTQGKEPVKVVANLPYYITTPIIMALLEGHIPLKNITVMVQKEVAERMQAGPGTKDYGALSLAVQYYTKPKIVAQVPPNCFIPRPGVGSAVIRLDRYEKPPAAPEDEALLFGLIRAAFNQRRKTLANAIGNAAGLPYSRENVAEALEALNLPPFIRGEALTLEQFVELADFLHKMH